MNFAPLEPNGSELEPYFAAERDLVRAPDELRDRVMARAWTSLQSNSQFLSAERASRPRRVKLGITAAAAVMLSAMCALAFFAGYRAKSGNPAAPAQVLTVAPPLTVQQLPAPSIVVAIVPVAPPPLHSARAEPTHARARPDNGNPVGTAKTAINLEAYTKELQVLQPARQAVTRGDFTTALSAIGEHQSQFPSGKLAEEREALRIKALLGLGRIGEAQRVGATFRARFAHSALLKRIDEMLGSQK
jgi:hypothetical protein